jgi:hypothetical protein
MVVSKMGSKLEALILIILILILAKLYGETFVGMMKIILLWIWNALGWFVDLVGKVSPK